LANLSCGTAHQTQVVGDLGVIPILAELLSSSNTEVVDHTIWVVGNIAADRILYRDAINKHGAIHKIVSIL
jgi:hypothetical protein